MKTRRTFQLLAAGGAFLTLLPLTGCMTAGGAAKIVNALAKDPATAHVRITTPWGSVDYERSVPPKPTP